VTQRTARHPLRAAWARHEHLGGHGHRHGPVDDSVKRSRAGLRAVGGSLAVLGLTAAAQTAIFATTGSIALLADLIHNFGDAATAIPLGLAFLLHSARAERRAGLAVVLAIFASACVAGYEAVDRLAHPRAPGYLWALALAGALGFAGNWLAAGIRGRAGRRLQSPALVADSDHARADAYVSLGVVASAGAVALGLEVADPLIGLAISALILRITWQSWRTVRASSTGPRPARQHLAGPLAGVASGDEAGTHGRGLEVDPASAPASLRHGANVVRLSLHRALLRGPGRVRSRRARLTSRGARWARDTGTAQESATAPPPGRAARSGPGSRPRAW
jgi:Co/Zn/Cd efflux system component